MHRSIKKKSPKYLPFLFFHKLLSVSLKKVDLPLVPVMIWLKISLHNVNIKSKTEELQVKAAS